eukprot:gene8502-8684_t
MTTVESAENGRPAKKARPTSVEDVVMEHATAASGQPAGAAGSKAFARGMLTLGEIAGDRLTQLAAQHWSEAARAAGSAPAFSPDLVKQIYQQELGGGSSRPPALKRIMLLEVSQYLEGYLWPNFDAAASSDAHVLSIIIMVNDKFREGVAPWTCFNTRKDAFPAFFGRVLALRAGSRRQQLAQHELTSYLLFIINAFQSLEDEMVRPQVLKLVSLPIWHGLSPGRLQLELAAQPALAKRWKALLKKERFVEWLIDLLSQLPTRRFVHALIEDQQLLVKARRSMLYSSPRGHLFQQLLDLLGFYCDFPLNDHTGEQLKDDDVVATHYDKVCQLQRLLFKYWPQLHDLSLASCAAACSPDGLKRALSQLTTAELQRLVWKQLRLVGQDDPWAQDRDFLLDVVVTSYQRRASQRAAINAMPLYPTEGLLWDTTQVI